MNNLVTEGSSLGPAVQRFNISRLMKIMSLDICEILSDYPANY